MIKYSQVNLSCLFFVCWASIIETLLDVM
jgi:hypothetical protein